MNEDKRYSVSIEICHILDRQQAERLAKKIRDRLNDMDEDVYVCIADYVQVRSRKPMLIINEIMEELKK